ncbi:MAG TPA: hypothetical protein V6D15_24635 [Oculatellaceae cyanobacterium]
MKRYFQVGTVTISLATTALVQMPTPLLSATKNNINQCIAPQQELKNQATYNYQDSDNSDLANLFSGISNQIAANVAQSEMISIVAMGVADHNQNLALGNITGAITEQLIQQGFSREQATKGILAVSQEIQQLPNNTTVAQITTTAKNALSKAVAEKPNLINKLENLDNQKATEIFNSIFQDVGLNSSQANSVTSKAFNAVIAAPAEANLDQVAQVAFQSLVKLAPNQVTTQTASEPAQASDSKTTIHQGEKLNFQFLVSNLGNQPTKIVTPNSTSSEPQILAPGSQMKMTVEVAVGAVPENGTSVTVALNRHQEQLQASVSGSGAVTNWKYEKIAPQSNEQLPECTSLQTLSALSTVTNQTVVMLPPANVQLKNPLGNVTGCAGEILPDYTGFSVGLYEPADSLGGIAGLVPLTGTELPDVPNNKIPKGIEPNKENSNPYFLTNGNQGKYSFLFDSNKGQLNQGKTYVLLVNPPEGKNYNQRRLRIVIGQRNGTIISYTATSLDGQPISATDNSTSVNGTIDIQDAEKVGLVLAVLNLNMNTCNSQGIQIIKTGDRAAAEPGDTVIYRLSVKNLSAASLDNITVTDKLPLGFQFKANSVRGESQGQGVAVTATNNNSNIEFKVPGNIPTGQVVNIAYAAALTPDAMRGSGKNSAIVNARRTDINLAVKDGPAIHQLRIQPGIATDCGTVIGRVFVDKNFDGEQQPGEPGVPNSVVLMDDGNRITTDAKGLFSVINVLPGYRTGVLDLSSLPGYTLAPNVRFKERNSQSRLVHLAPGALVRMNFAVTPSSREATP